MINKSVSSHSEGAKRLKNLKENPSGKAFPPLAPTLRLGRLGLYLSRPRPTFARQLLASAAGFGLCSEYQNKISRSYGQGHQEEIRSRVRISDEIVGRLNLKGREELLCR